MKNNFYFLLLRGGKHLYVLHPARSGTERSRRKKYCLDCVRALSRPVLILSHLFFATMDKYIKSIPFEKLPPRFKSSFPICDDVVVIRMSLGQELLYQQTKVSAAKNGNVLKLFFGASMIYHTINNQIVVVKVLVSNIPLIIMVNCGSVRGSKCFYYKHRNYFSNYRKWYNEQWNIVCPDVVQAGVIDVTHQPLLCCNTYLFHVEMTAEGIHE